MTDSESKLVWWFDPDTHELRTNTPPPELTERQFKEQKWPPCPVCGRTIIVDPINIQLPTDRFPVYIPGSWACPIGCVPGMDKPPVQFTGASCRVAVTVFARVHDAADEDDAGNVVAHLIRAALPMGQTHKVKIQMGQTHKVKIQSDTWRVMLYDAMETGAAAGGGYLSILPTLKGYDD